MNVASRFMQVKSCVRRAFRRSIGLATKRVLHGERPKFMTVLKIFTEKKLATSILGGRHDQGVVNG